MIDLIKALVRGVLPKSLATWWRRRFGWQWFRGDYARWAEARAAASGYDDGAVLAKVLAAARAVKAGRAVWDRDGIAFTEPVIHKPLLQVLSQIAEQHEGHLEIVDFGGALGNTWRQHRAALRRFSVRWRVVEQPAWVEAGRREFADEILSFHDSLPDAFAGGTVTVVLFSSVLPYLEKPYIVREEAAHEGINPLIVDRTPFVAGGRDRLVVQHTPPQLGGGSYPCWLFDRTSLVAPLDPEYELADEWPVSFDRVDGTANYLGLHFRRRRPIAPVFR